VKHRSLPPEAKSLEERALRLVNEPKPAAVEELVTFAEGRRAPLELARDGLMERLRRRSCDFDATRALRLIDRSLMEVGWPGGEAGRPW